MDLSTLHKLVDPQTKTALEAIRPDVMSLGEEEFRQTADILTCDVIKMLTADAVQKANSGHPGGPMSCVDFAHVLHTRFIRASGNHRWEDRDRFVLSGGHMSMLIYSILYFQGRLDMKDLENFRQLGCRTQGHPILGICPGIETSTGPLGQGFANGVGMALAEAYLRNVYGPQVVDHRTFVLASDGDLQEGVCREAASLAGHLKLSRLKVFYDCNAIQLASPTAKTMSEDTAAIFRSYGWLVLELPDGNDHGSLTGAIRAALTESHRPVLIIGHTVIARDTQKAGSVESHGSPLGQPVIDDFKKRKKHPGTPFWAPALSRELYQAQLRRGDVQEKAWAGQVAHFRSDSPELAAAYDLAHGHTDGKAYIDNLRKVAAAFPLKDKPAATRSSAGDVMAAFKDVAPHLFGGSADLANSTKTDTFEKAVGYFPDALTPGVAKGRAVHYGVREHAMGSMTNGLTAHGGLLGFTGTFLAFSDYMRPAIRLAAISKLPSVFIFTHDSIFLGEDGETHQPVEQVAALRLIPHLVTLRPADAAESLAAWSWILEQNAQEGARPVCLVLSRQNLPLLGAAKEKAPEGLRRGAYVLMDADKPQIQVLATGSEVQLAVAAAALLEKKYNERARIISMPSMELFREQPADYRASVLLPGVRARLSIEAGTTLGWKEWTGDAGDELGIDRFGESAPDNQLAEKYGFTAENACERMHAVIAKGR